jgi:hypothetical protein
MDIFSPASFMRRNVCTVTLFTSLFIDLSGRLMLKVIKVCQPFGDIYRYCADYAAVLSYAYTLFQSQISYNVNNPDFLRGNLDWHFN